MAAKSKRRLSVVENKLVKLDKLQLKDVVCSICQNILVEPVTLPCFHDFCHSCFIGSIENNSLCCPLCRLRIGSWLRASKKQNNLVNAVLWNFLKTKFPEEIQKKYKGEDIDLPEEAPILRISAPGEIRSEYEGELERLKAERLRLEQIHLKDTELLIKQIQKEEEEAHQRYLERLKQDELLAKQMQREDSKLNVPPNTPKRCKQAAVKQKVMKTPKIDEFISKKINSTTIKSSHDEKVTNTVTNNENTKTIQSSRVSPEMVPRGLKQRMLNGAFWNKENGAAEKDENQDLMCQNPSPELTCKKNKIQSVPVSLPYTGILQHKNVTDNRNAETGSVDSMRQELCYFKPLHPYSPTNFSGPKNVPVRVPSIRPQPPPCVLASRPPSRVEYLAQLCTLRNVSLQSQLPSAFVLALGLLTTNVGPTVKPDTESKEPTSNCDKRAEPTKKTSSNRSKHVDAVTTLDSHVTRRRTRSMGSIKDENETTPKKTKTKERKASSEKKSCLRGDSKKNAIKRRLTNLDLIPESSNINKVEVELKKLSSPLENCDVKEILAEQLRIEKLIEQEKKDFELARKLEEQWNGRQLRRASGKRQVPLNHTLRPGKKIKV